jgi:hypothetical protein
VIGHTCTSTAVASKLVTEFRPKAGSTCSSTVVAGALATLSTA